MLRIIYFFILDISECVFNQIRSHFLVDKNIRLERGGCRSRWFETRLPTQILTGFLLDCIRACIHHPNKFISQLRVQNFNCLLLITGDCHNYHSILQSPQITNHHQLNLINDIHRTNQMNTSAVLAFNCIDFFLSLDEICSSSIVSTNGRQILTIFYYTY